VVQLTSHDFLRSLGIALIPATAPDFFTEDTPTAVLVRQVLGPSHSLEDVLSRQAQGRARRSGICFGPQKRLFRHARAIRAVLTCSWQNEALDLTRWPNLQAKSLSWIHRAAILPSLVAEPDAPIELDRLKDELAVIGCEKCSWHSIS
jgi:hypothetical protein